MDRRSLLYVILISGILFGVNWYFEKENQTALQEWNAQQKIKKEQKIKQYEKDITQRTVLPSALPLIEKDQTKGVQVKGQSLFLKPLENSPDKLVFSTDNLYVYGKEHPPLLVGALPDFGQFDLQIYFPDANQVLLGEWIDGNLLIPEDKIAELKKEIGVEEAPSALLNQRGIALSKIDGQYLPLAIYSRRGLEWLDEIPGLKTTSLSRTSKDEQEKKEERYYVLENPYQQLVFSNYGAALVEVNLPFQNKSDPKSVVKEIEFDRQMVQTEPQNAYFPGHPYLTPDQEFHEKGKLGGYYPLIRRDLIQSQGRQSVKIAPRYYALNIISDYPEVAQLVYEVKSFTNRQIVFESDLPHRKITKTYTLEEDPKGPYILTLDIKIEGDSRNLWLTSGVPEVEWISGGPSPSLKYRITKNQSPVVEQIDLPKDAVTMTSINLDWVVNSNGFLGLILDPLDQKAGGYRAQFIPGTSVPSRLIEIDQQYDRFPAANLPGYMLMLPLKPTGNSPLHFRVFAGPFATDILKTVDKNYSDPATGYNPDYIAAQTFHGWFSFISEPFAKFLLLLMTFFYKFTGSWALSIVLLTVALRVMLYPLNAWSLKSTIQMQKIAPEITAIQEKNKKDPKKAQMEIVNLYRERGVNPLSGCLPLLIQMPFLIGMFDLLKSTFELRGASFIPGWIDNLAAPDVLFTWSYPLPFIGNAFHLLPILLGAVMFFQQRMMSPLPKDQSLWTDQQRQQRTMGTMMTFLFTFMFYHFPSGLNIYWLSSMLLGILQQWWTAKRMQTPAPTTDAKGVVPKR